MAEVAEGVPIVVGEDKWPYQSATTIMLPYKADQTAFFPEDFLVSLYCRLVEQDLLSTIFPGMGIGHLNKFVSYMGSHPVLICLKRDDSQITDVAGFGYIPETDGVDGARKASFGFGFFREYWATQEARTLSFFMLSFWIKELKIDALFGTTLKANGLARNFSQNFGFNIICDIPKLFFRNGQLEDATVMLLERDSFLLRYEAWRETLDTEQAG